MGLYMETMTGRDYYITRGYNELPETVRAEMRRIFDTGINDSGVWVRYREVENLAGIMAYEYTHYRGDDMEDGDGDGPVS